VFATFVPVAHIVPAKANLYILAFSNPYFTSENPAANVSHISVTVTVSVAYVALTTIACLVQDCVRFNTVPLCSSCS